MLNNDTGVEAGITTSWDLSLVTLRYVIVMLDTEVLVVLPIYSIYIVVLLTLHMYSLDPMWYYICSATWGPFALIWPSPLVYANGEGLSPCHMTDPGMGILISV